MPSGFIQGTQVSGNTVTITVTGGSVDGYTLDGENVIAYTPPQGQPNICVITGLPSGTHTITVFDSVNNKSGSVTVTIP